MYRYIEKYDIRYTDVDAYDTLRLSSILSVMEEAACHSADELGFGYDVIMPQHVGFILSNWYIELDKPIKLDDKLEIHTWPLKPSHVIFNRDFEIYANGEKAGVATSRWCMINLTNYTMMPINAYFKDPDFFNDYNTQHAVEFKTWKIPAVQGGEPAYEKLIVYTDYDHYMHVNNTKYADFVMDCFTVEEMADKFLSKVQISYVKQCKMGETISFYRQDLENGVTIVEGRCGDDVRVQMKLTFAPVPAKA